VKSYLLTPEDERLVVIEEDRTAEDPVTVAWTARNLGQKVLRRYKVGLSSAEGWHSWSWEQDYAYRGAQVLASFKPDNREEHFHLDHLGTIRAKTWLDTTGTPRFEAHKYLPYGQELTTPGLESLQFTAHERDRGPGTNRQQDLDYMHARYYTASMGRFLSVDPGRDGWNLYSYAGGNPIKYVDPDGRFFGIFGNAVAQNPTVKNIANAVFDFVSGAGDAVTSNAVGGADRTDGGSAAFQVGQAVGDAASIVQGAFEMAAGTTVATGGTLVTAGTGGVASPASVPAAVGGAAAAAHGAVMGAAGAKNLGDSVSQMSSGGSSGGSRELGKRFRSTDDPLQQLEEIENAQDAVRKGKSNQIIDSTEKSRQRARNFLNKVKKLEDAPDG
jgi:RHS repeat-associated protein